MSTAPVPQPTTQITAATYADLKARHNIPDAPDTFDAGQTVIQRMYVDLGALTKELQDRKLDGTTAALPGRLLVFCDLLNIGTGNTGALNTNLRVFTRRVESSAPLTLPPTGSITIYTNEFAGSLIVTLVENGNSLGGVEIRDVTGLGFGVRKDGAALSRTALLNFGLLRDMPETQNCLERTYLYASLLYEETPALSVPLLRWIQRATASWAGDIQNLYLQSSAMLCTADLRAGSSSFVPWLAKEIYTRETSAFLAAAQRFEENYNQFRSAQNTLQQRATYARMMLLNYQDMEEVSGKLVAQAQANFDDADESVTYYRNQVQDQQLVIARAKIDFEYGIKRYQEEKKLELGLEIVSAIFSLGMAAGSIALGMPDTKALDSVVKAGKTTKEAVEALEKLGKVAEKLKTIGETMQKLSAISAKLKSINGMKPPSLDMSAAGKGETDDASWEIFRDKVTEIIDPAIEKGIGGAVSYKLALLALTSYGKALNQSQAQYIAAGQELSRLLLQQAANARQSERMAEYIAEMEKAKEPNEEMMRWLLQRYGTVKRWLLLALGNYNDAFRYWALEQPATKASFNQTVAEIQEVLGNVVRAESGVLQKFRPAPQPFRDYRIAVQDAGSVQAFKQNRRLSIEVKLDARVFAGNERVRLREIRVWLEGVASPDPIRIFISSTGAYADRYKRVPFAFATSWPLEWGFRYATPSREIQMNAAFADQFRAFYFEPTPFTTWTVRVPDQSLDLSGLTGIVLEFSGSAIARD